MFTIIKRRVCVCGELNPSFKHYSSENRQSYPTFYLHAYMLHSRINISTTTPHTYRLLSVECQKWLCVRAPGPRSFGSHFPP